MAAAVVANIVDNNRKGLFWEAYTYTNRGIFFDGLHLFLQLLKLFFRNVHYNGQSASRYKKWCHSIAKLKK